MQMQKLVNQHNKNLQAIAGVVTKYNLGDLDFTIAFQTNLEDEPEINVHCYDADRETVLVILGDLLGRNNWERKLQYGNESYRWVRTIDGVKIVIYDAEKIAKPVERPVAASDFPLQLTEAVA